MYDIDEEQNIFVALLVPSTFKGKTKWYWYWGIIQYSLDHKIKIIIIYDGQMDIVCL